MLSLASPSQSLSQGEQLAFLRRVAHDDRFRVKLESDPQTALAEYGLQLDSTSLPKRVTLPDESAILSLIKDLDDGVRPPDVPWVGWIRD